MIVRASGSLLACVVLLALWLGAAALTAGVVAPAAFAVLPTRTLAGALVGRVLPVIFWTGMAVGLITAVVGARAGAGGLMLAFAGAVTAACAIAQLVIVPRIEVIRRSIPGAMDALAVDDVRRVAFGRLHGFSVLWMGVAGIAALGALGLALRELSRRSAA